ncbi:MAG: hypothetical protein COA60_004440 [Robiginitomaculum sp.]|nr:hypothetical protein [Robiginitomaculum sp.]
MKQFIKIIALSLLGIVMVASSPALAAPSGDSGKKSSRTSANPNFVEFPQMISSVLDGYRVRGMIILGFGLEIEDDDLRYKTTKLLPRLQDSYNREFNIYASTLYRSGELPDAEHISKRMQMITDRILGKDKAVFLISNLMVRQN